MLFLKLLKSACKKHFKACAPALREAYTGMEGGVMLNGKAVDADPKDPLFAFKGALFGICRQVSATYPHNHTSHTLQLDTHFSVAEAHRRSNLR